MSFIYVDSSSINSILKKIQVNNMEPLGEKFFDIRKIEYCMRDSGNHTTANGLVQEIKKKWTSYFQ